MQSYRDYEDFDPHRKPVKPLVEKPGSAGYTKLPDGVRVLCILTIVGSSAGILVSLFWLLLLYFAGSWRPPLAGAGSSSLSQTQITHFTFWGIFIACSVFTIIGAGIMLTAKKAGLWIYSIAQLVHISLVFLALADYFGSDTGIPFTSLEVSNLLICSGFTIAYWLNKNHFR